MAAATSTLLFFKQEPEERKDGEKLSGFESGLRDEETERMETSARAFCNNLKEHAKRKDGERLHEDHGVAASTEVHDLSWALLTLQRLVNRRTVNRHRYSTCRVQGFGWYFTVDSQSGL